MGQVYNLFSADEDSPTTYSLESANKLLPLVRKYTEEAIQRTESISIKLNYFPQSSAEFKALCEEYDQVIEKWAERVHRLGAQAKGLWLVDFDTGEGYLCWSYPETKIEHFHSYDGGFKTRVKVV